MRDEAEDVGSQYEVLACNIHLIQEHKRQLFDNHQKTGFILHTIPYYMQRGSIRTQVLLQKKKTRFQSGNNYISTNQIKSLGMIYIYFILPQYKTGPKEGPFQPYISMSNSA